jgi:hypothetical protein
MRGRKEKEKKKKNGFLLLTFFVTTSACSKTCNRLGHPSQFFSFFYFSFLHRFLQQTLAAVKLL